jgi:hypothetical protein
MSRPALPIDLIAANNPGSFIHDMPLRAPHHNISPRQKNASWGLSAVRAEARKPDEAVL